MDIENKNPKEIQELIFAEIRNGASIEALKNELREKGLHPEGYYFTTEAEHQAILEEPRTPAGQVSGWQIALTIVTLIILVFRIARCSSRM